jgi:hypothetical protein
MPPNGQAVPRKVAGFRVCAGPRARRGTAGVPHAGRPRPEAHTRPWLDPGSRREYSFGMAKGGDDRTDVLQGTLDLMVNWERLAGIIARLREQA